MAREREEFHYQVSVARDLQSTAFSGGENSNSEPTTANAVMDEVADGFSVVAEGRSAFMHERSANADDRSASAGDRSAAANIAARATRQLGFKDRLQYATRLYEPASADESSVSELPAQPTYTLPNGWKISAYIHNTYIILETPEGMEIVEQHIAHERTLYERLLAQQEVAGRITECAQRLLVSTPLELSPEQTNTLKGSVEILRKLGFDFDLQSETVTCTQVPLELAHKDYACVVQEIVATARHRRRCQPGAGSNQIDCLPISNQERNAYV